MFSLKKKLKLIKLKILVFPIKTHIIQCEIPCFLFTKKTTINSKNIKGIKKIK